MSRRLGRIRFQYTDGTGTGICGAYVDYVKETGNKNMILMEHIEIWQGWHQL